MIDTPDRILRLNTVLDRTGLSRSTLYRKLESLGLEAEATEHAPVN